MKKYYYQQLQATEGKKKKQPNEPNDLIKRTIIGSDMKLSWLD